MSVSSAYTCLRGLVALLGVYAFDVMVSELLMLRKMKQTIPTGPLELLVPANQCLRPHDCTARSLFHEEYFPGLFHCS